MIPAPLPQKLENQRIRKKGFKDSLNASAGFKNIATQEHTIANGKTLKSELCRSRFSKNLGRATFIMSAA
jgi:hypothetical protein